MTGVPSTAADPLSPLVDLPGVADAVARARDAVTTVHNHPVNRRGWPATSAEAALRGARASAALDGAPLEPVRADHVEDPMLAGAVRVADERDRLLDVWRTAPMQGLARLHMLAAADLVPVEDHSRVLGRPQGDAEVSGRLSLLAGFITGGTSVPAPVLVAVVHGELLGLRPFGTANGVVARAAARLTAMSSGLDPRGLAVPEVGTPAPLGRVPLGGRRVRRRHPGGPGGVDPALLRPVGGRRPGGHLDRGGAGGLTRPNESGGAPLRGAPPDLHDNRDPGVHYVSCRRPRRPASRYAGPRRHASRGVLGVEVPGSRARSPDGGDGYFSAVPPLA